MSRIRVRDASKSFGDVRAVAELSVSIGSGELFGLLGANGAGKTTTIRLLTGQLRPDAGHIEVDGTDPVADPIETRRRVGVLPEDGAPPSFFTPREYFRYVAQVGGMDPDAALEEVRTWANRLGFDGRLDTLATDLSRGQQQKVMITGAFLDEPDVVFIDEPLANLDPIVQEEVKRFLSSYVEADRTVLLSTHNVEVAEDLCTRVGVLSGGRLVAERDVADLEGPLLEVLHEAIDDRAGAPTDPPGDSPATVDERIGSGDRPSPGADGIVPSTSR